MAPQLAVDQLFRIAKLWALVRAEQLSVLCVY